MTNLGKLIGLTLVSLAVIGCSPAKDDSTDNAVALDDKLRQTATQTLEAFNIPGLAIVAVKDGEVVLAEGFGVRDIGTGDPVTEDTLFGIASHTKAFTAAAIATLVEEGTLDWDDKVVDYLPDFRLSDPVITQQLTIRDLLSHRSGLGLGAGDLMIWPNTDKSVDDIIAGLAHVPIEDGFREQFNYNNLMFVTAGEVIHQVTGVPYHQYIEQQLFQPIGMDDSIIGHSRIPKTYQNVAFGTIEMNGELHRFPLDFLEDFGGAGATAASVEDMGYWLKTLLNKGTSPSGEEIISSESLHEMWQLTTPLPVASNMADQGTYFRGYGLGWFVKDYHGVKQVYHSGGILGMLSLTTLIPEKNFGITVMSNQQAFGGLTAVTQEALEEVLNLEDLDWVALKAAEYQSFMDDKASFEIEPVADQQPALALERYAGTYKDNWYGKVTIKKDGEQLRIDFSHTDMLKGTLEHYNGNTFVVRWDEPLLEADAFIDFETNRNNRVQYATMEAAAPFTDFSFDFHNLRLQKQ